MHNQIESERLLQIDYTNWKGERAWRTIEPIYLWLGQTEWHTERQWLLKATDLDKKAQRDFAVTGIHEFRAVEDKQADALLHDDQYLLRVALHSTVRSPPYHSGLELSFRKNGEVVRIETAGLVLPNLATSRVAQLNIVPSSGTVTSIAAQAKEFSSPRYKRLREAVRKLHLRDIDTRTAPLLPQLIPMLVAAMTPATSTPIEDTPMSDCQNQPNTFSERQPMSAPRPPATADENRTVWRISFFCQNTLVGACSVHSPWPITAGSPLFYREGLRNDSLPERFDIVQVDFGFLQSKVCHTDNTAMVTDPRLLQLRTNISKLKAEGECAVLIRQIQMLFDALPGAVTPVSTPSPQEQQGDVMRPVKEQPAWFQRVLEERKELGVKCEKLAFYLKNRPDDTELSDTLLQMQLNAMRAYRQALDLRIQLHNEGVLK